MASKLDPNATASVTARNKKIGLLLILGPFVGLFLILVAFAIASFILSSMIETSSITTGMSGAAPDIAINENGSLETGARLINVALGFLGIIFVFAIPICLVLGIRYLRKKDHDSQEKNDPRSGKGDEGEIPPEVKKWNWGAFFLTFIWGIYHDIWISLLAFVPLVNLVIPFYLGAKGNELAWRKNKWESIEKFHQSQKKWAMWGLIIFLVTIPFYFLPGLEDEGQSSINSEGETEYRADVLDPQEPTRAIQTTNDSETWKTYTPIDGGFKIDFPNFPVREREAVEDGEISFEIITYVDELDGASYYVISYIYSDPALNENNSDFDVATALEAMLNELINTPPTSNLITASRTIFRGKQAVQYEMSGQGERLDGIFLMNDNRVYNIAVNYADQEKTPPGFQKFMNSFQLRP